MLIFDEKISMIKRISIIKNKGLDFAQFWSKPNESAWDRWKTAQTFRGKYLHQVFVKNVVCMDKKHEMITDKVETLLRGQSDPAFQKDTK